MQMDEGARNYLYKYAKKNHWRVAAWIDFDDLIQEGYYAYYYTINRYKDAKTPQHIMSLFKLVLCSTIEDLVRANTKQVDDARSDIVETCDNMVLPDFSNLHALLIKAPQAIKDVLALLADDKQRDELTKPFTKYDNGRRETLNDRLCRLLNIDSKKDLVGEVRSYFS